MSAFTIPWSCPECGAQVVLPATVKSTGTVRDEHGKATGITLTPEVDGAPALTHMVDEHLVVDTWTPTT